MYPRTLYGPYRNEHYLSNKANKTRHEIAVLCKYFAGCTRDTKIGFGFFDYLMQTLIWASGTSEPIWLKRKVRKFKCKHPELFE